MTGFGCAEKVTPSGTYHVEIRGVNNRFLDIQFRIPKSFASLEQKIKQVLAASISRGSLSVNISWDSKEGQTRLTWDRDKVADYIRIFKEIKKVHKLEGKVALSSLVGLSDFITAKDKEYDEATLWRHVKPVLEKAVAQFQRSRETEAAAIVRDMRAMTSKLRAALEEIQQKAPHRLAAYSASLKKKIEGLAGDTAVEPQRLATEVALMADRLDISEECTRLAAHIDKFTDDLNADDPAGKRMTFILQEMNREANTIGSKANDSDIAHLSVKMKELIEQIREQAQNIE